MYTSNNRYEVSVINADLSNNWKELIQGNMTHIFKLLNTKSSSIKEPIFIYNKENHDLQREFRTHPNADIILTGLPIDTKKSLNENTKISELLQLIKRHGLEYRQLVLVGDIYEKVLAFLRIGLQVTLYKKYPAKGEIKEHTLTKASQLQDCLSYHEAGNVIEIKTSIFDFNHVLHIEADDGGISIDKLNNFSQQAWVSNWRIEKQYKFSSDSEKSFLIKMKDVFIILPQQLGLLLEKQLRIEGIHNIRLFTNTNDAVQNIGKDNLSEVFHYLEISKYRILREVLSEAEVRYFFSYAFPEKTFIILKDCFHRLAHAPETKPTNIILNGLPEEGFTVLIDDWCKQHPNSDLEEFLLKNEHIIADKLKHIEINKAFWSFLSKEKQKELKEGMYDELLATADAYSDENIQNASLANAVFQEKLGEFLTVPLHKKQKIWKEKTPESQTLTLGKLIQFEATKFLKKLPPYTKHLFLRRLLQLHSKTFCESFDTKTKLALLQKDYNYCASWFSKNTDLLLKIFKKKEFFNNLVKMVSLLGGPIEEMAFDVFVQEEAQERRNRIFRCFHTEVGNGILQKLLPRIRKVNQSSVILFCLKKDRDELLQAIPRKLHRIIMIDNEIDPGILGKILPYQEKKCDYRQFIPYLTHLYELSEKRLNTLKKSSLEYYGYAGMSRMLNHILILGKTGALKDQGWKSLQEQFCEEFKLPESNLQKNDVDAAIQKMKQTVTQSAIEVENVYSTRENLYREHEKMQDELSKLYETLQNITSYIQDFKKQRVNIANKQKELSQTFHEITKRALYDTITIKNFSQEQEEITDRIFKYSPQQIQFLKKIRIVFCALSPIYTSFVENLRRLDGLDDDFMEVKRFEELLESNDTPIDVLFLGSDINPLDITNEGVAKTKNIIVLPDETCITELTNSEKNKTELTPNYQKAIKNRGKYLQNYKLIKKNANVVWLDLQKNKRQLEEALNDLTQRQTMNKNGYRIQSSMQLNQQKTLGIHEILSETFDLFSKLLEQYSQKKFTDKFARQKAIVNICGVLLNQFNHLRHDIESREFTQRFIHFSKHAIARMQKDIIEDMYKRHRFNFIDRQINPELYIIHDNSSYAQQLLPGIRYTLAHQFRIKEQDIKIHQTFESFEKKFNQLDQQKNFFVMIYEEQTDDMNDLLEKVLSFKEKSVHSSTGVLFTEYIPLGHSQKNTNSPLSTNILILNELCYLINLKNLNARDEKLLNVIFNNIIINQLS